jgi:hypothetical protein
MAGMFVDSFDPYNTLSLKWSSGTAPFNTNPAFVRTGTQSLSPQGGSFSNLPRINFTTRLGMTVGVAFYQVSAVGNVDSMKWQNSAEGWGIDLIVNIDGSLTAQLSGSGQDATSSPGIIGVGQFYYIEVQATFGNSDAETLIVRVDGATVISYTGQISDGVHAGINSFFLPGSLIDTIYYDDLYVLDSTPSSNPDNPNDGFLGAIRVYAILPDLDETPIDFTPLAGTNVSQVNQAPPPGDSAYVFSSTVGATDLYHYPITGLPSNIEIKCVQHSLCCRLDAAGSHTVMSQCNATTGQAAIVGINTPGEDYDYVLCVYDNNPNTGEQFQPADFATTWLGPTITA